MIRVAILIFTPTIFGSLGGTVGWWLEAEPVFCAIVTGLVGLGVALRTDIDDEMVS